MSVLKAGTPLAVGEPSLIGNTTRKRSVIIAGEILKHL
jgi:hypothetical protein